MKKFIFHKFICGAFVLLLRWNMICSEKKVIAERGERSVDFSPNIGKIDLKCVTYVPNINCSWNQKCLDGGKVKQTLFQTILYNNDSVADIDPCMLSESSVERFHVCLDEDITCINGLNHCYLGRAPSHIHLYYYFVLQINYTIGNKPLCSFSDLVIEVAETVKMGKILKFNAQPKVKGMRVSWKQPKHASLTRLLKYNITFVSQFHNYVDIFTSANTSITLDTPEDLIPYTSYNITIVCIMNIGTVDKGYWSEPLKATEMTLQSVPGANPDVSPGGFKIDASTKAGYVTVTFYWKRVPAKYRHGIFTKIEVCVKDITSAAQDSEPECTNHTVNNDQEPLYTELPDIKTDRSHSVTVEALTDKGRNKNLKLLPVVIRSQQSRLAVPEKFVVRNNGSDISVAWFPVHKAVRYTVYWCQINQEPECKDGEMHRQVVEGNTTEVKLSHLVHDNRHSFAISAEKLEELINGTFQYTSSGLNFASCVHDSEKDISKPEEFKYAVEKFQNAESLKVEWKTPDCEHTDYIDEYVLEYWKAGHPDETRTEKIPFGVESWELRNLEGNTAYKVAVYSRNRWSKRSVTTVLEEKLVKQSGINSAVWTSLIVIIVIILCLVFSCLLFRKCKKRNLPRPLINSEDLPPQRSKEVHRSSESENIPMNVEYKPFTPLNGVDRNGVTGNTGTYVNLPQDENGLLSSSTDIDVDSRRGDDEIETSQHSKAA